MASFGSAGAGFARAFATQQQLSQNRRQLKLQEEELAQAKAQRQQAQFRQAVDDSEEKSLEVFDQHLQFMSEASQFAEPDDPRIQQIQQGAMAALMGHAAVLEDIRQRAIANGAPPEIVEQLPSGAEFVQSRLPVLEAAQSTARMKAEAKPVEQSQFQADVEGIGNARVTAVERPEGGFDFFVGDKPVSADEIGPSTQKRQEVTDFQIPGLTAAQSGQEVTKLRQLAAANNSFAQVANNVAKKVKDSPEKVGTVADVLRGFSSLTSQAEAVANLFGIENRWMNENGEPATIEDFDFGPLASAAAGVKRTLLDLVFLDLASKGQTGRAVSDRDLAIFMENTGINSGDPEQVIAGLREGVRNNQTILRENALVRSGGAFGLQDIAPEGITEFNEPLGQNVLGQGVNAAKEALEAGDIDRANAIMDAVEAGDNEALRKLLGG